MPIRVKVLSKPDKNFRKQQEEFVLRLSGKHTFALAEETVRIIRQNIQASIKRSGSTGNLASGFFTEKILNGHGVGNIDELNRELPYWAWMNDGIAGTGRRIPPGSDEVNNRGAFQPGDSAPGTGSNQRWRVGTGFHLIFPKNPIEAKNYIENTISEILTKAPNIIGKIKE